MKICIIGAGAMGGLYGGRLIMAGQEVSFVDSRQDVVDNINQNGLHVTGIDGEPVSYTHLTLPTSALV